MENLGFRDGHFCDPENEDFPEPMEPYLNQPVPTFLSDFYKSEK